MQNPFTVQYVLVSRRIASANPSIKTTLGPERTAVIMVSQSETSSACAYPIFEAIKWARSDSSAPCIKSGFCRSEKISCKTEVLHIPLMPKNHAFRVPMQRLRVIRSKLSWSGKIVEAYCLFASRDAAIFIGTPFLIKDSGYSFSEKKYFIRWMDKCKICTRDKWKNVVKQTKLQEKLDR